MSVSAPTVATPEAHRGMPVGGEAVGVKKPGWDEPKDWKESGMQIMTGDPSFARRIAKAGNKVAGAVAGTGAGMIGLGLASAAVGGPAVAAIEVGKAGAALLGGALAAEGVSRLAGEYTGDVKYNRAVEHALSANRFGGWHLAEKISSFASKYAKYASIGMAVGGATEAVGATALPVVGTAAGITRDVGSYVNIGSPVVGWLQKGLNVFGVGGQGVNTLLSAVATPTGGLGLLGAGVLSAVMWNVNKKISEKRDVIFDKAAKQLMVQEGEKAPKLKSDEYGYMAKTSLFSRFSPVQALWWQSHKSEADAAAAGKTPTGSADVLDVFRSGFEGSRKLARMLTLGKSVPTVVIGGLGLLGMGPAAVGLALPAALVTAGVAQHLLQDLPQWKFMSLYDKTAAHRYHKGTRDIERVK